MDIRAGNPAHATAVFTRPAGVVTSVNPSTVKVAVSTQTGTVVATLTPSALAYNADNSGFTVTADWAIPDATAQGYYTITFDSSGGLVAAVEQTVRVLARTLAVVP